MFDPDQLLDQETQTVFEENYTPVPENEYTGMIEKVSAGEGGGNPLLRLTWLLEVPDEVKKEMGVDLGEEIRCGQTIWLDVNESGGLAGGPNKNVQLGKLRAALGQNDGSPWNPRMLEGRPAKVFVKQKANNETGAIYSNVVSVSAPH